MWRWQHFTIVHRPRSPVQCYRPPWRIHVKGPTSYKRSKDMPASADSFTRHTRKTGSPRSTVKYAIDGTSRAYFQRPTHPPSVAHTFSLAGLLRNPKLLALTEQICLGDCRRFSSMLQGQRDSFSVLCVGLCTPVSGLRAQPAAKGSMYKLAYEVPCCLPLTGREYRRRMLATYGLH